MSFILWNKTEKAYMQVYDVQYDQHNYPHFLVYDNKHWRLISAKHFLPAANLTKLQAYRGLGFRG